MRSCKASLYSCTNPTVTTMRMATVMEMASSTCPMAVETATEIRRSAMKGFQNC